MLRISKIVDYGILVLTHMAAESTHVCSAADLATSLGLGQPVVSKVLKLLAQTSAAHFLLVRRSVRTNSRTRGRHLDRLSRHKRAEPLRPKDIQMLCLRSACTRREVK